MAAVYQISPPMRANFSQPKEWPRWIRCFQQFRQASRLRDNSQESQVNIQIDAMGDEADDILGSLGLTDQQTLKCATVEQASQNLLSRGEIPSLNVRSSNNEEKKEVSP